ncbi:MAG: cyclodeaminase/cyclohydrolase family protein [Candidatus Omnitrophica bacterium]|nr:cyclodeaminase/cyclohydrolase family protein [Candidatus Omnitrophota bacterium]
MYKNMSVSEYLDQLAAKIPVPGGGSSSALCAACAAALVSMVVNFTLGKSQYLRYEKRLKDILNRSESIRNDFLRMVDLDAVAYKSHNTKDALSVPFMVSRLCLEGIRLCPFLIKAGNRNLLSDVAVAAVLFEAGFATASYNVKINLKVLNDSNISRKILNEINRNSKTVKRIRIELENKVDKAIRG